MIISNLRNIVREQNHTRSKYNKSPIHSIYQLYKELKKQHLKISRPILTRLWNDSPSRHINDKGDVYNEANSIKFDTLNRLVKFFNKPAGDFFSYIGEPITITIQTMKRFIMQYPKLINSMNLNDNKPGDSLIEINYLKRNPPYKFIVIAHPSIMSSGITGRVTYINIEYKYQMYTIINNNIKETDNMPDTHDIRNEMATFTNTQHRYFNSLIIRNGLLNNKQIRNLFKYSYSYQISTLDDIRPVVITSNDIRDPKHLLTNNKSTTYNFIFKDLH